MSETQNTIEGQPQPKYRDRLFIAIFGKDSERSKRWRQDGIIEGREQGLAEGAQEKAEEAARNALAMNLTVEQTAKITGLPLDQVLELQKELAPAQ